VQANRITAGKHPAITAGDDLRQRVAANVKRQPAFSS
jgi:hypothetical protein